MVSEYSAGGLPGYFRDVKLRLVPVKNALGLKGARLRLYYGGMPEHKVRSVARRKESTLIENPPGIFRATLAYNDQIMVCLYTMKKGATVPLHDHAAAQNGYVIRGRLHMTKDTGDGFLAESGTGYCFSPGEKHGAEVLEDSEVIECFAPMRPEYVVE
jgi:quercetin dioxygenase-like cupin family protein